MALRSDAILVSVRVHEGYIEAPIGHAPAHRAESPEAADGQRRREVRLGSASRLRSACAVVSRGRVNARGRAATQIDRGDDVLGSHRSRRRRSLHSGIGIARPSRLQPRSQRGRARHRELDADRRRAAPGPGERCTPCAGCPRRCPHRARCERDRRALLQRGGAAGAAWWGGRLTGPSGTRRSATWLMAAMGAAAR